MIEIIYGHANADELKKFFYQTQLSRRIEDISKYQFEQLSARIKGNSKYAIQIDKTTDISSKAQLLGYVRYCLNNNVHEDFLFCRALEGHTTGEAILLKVSGVLKEVGLKWEDCVEVCTDGAAAMLGKNVGFHAKVKSLNSGSITCTHCIIHQEALAAQKISAKLCLVLQDVVKIINYTESRALNSRLFSNLCEEMVFKTQTCLTRYPVVWYPLPDFETFVSYAS